MICLLADTCFHAAYSHIIDGKAVAARMVIQKCSAALVIITPNDWQTTRRVIVYLDGPHNHPAHPASSKETPANKALLQRAIAAVGAFGLTPRKLLRGASINQPLIVITADFGISAHNTGSL